MDVVRASQRLNEETTLDAISYIPAHLGVVKAKIRSLADEKPEWGIKVLEGEDSNIFQIENRYKVEVPLQYWDNFLTIFNEDLKGKDCLNFSVMLNEQLIEAVEEDMGGLRKELKPALTEMYNERQFKSLDKIINLWTSWFKVQSYKTREDKGPVVSQEKKNKDIQSLYGKLIRTYGEDKGNLEMLLENIDSNQMLSGFDVFKNYDFLYGTRIQSFQDRVSLIFEAMIDVGFNTIQSIYVGDKEVLDKIEEESRAVKRVGNVLYPVGGSFTSKFFRLLKEMVENITTDEDKEIE